MAVHTTISLLVITFALTMGFPTEDLKMAIVPVSEDYDFASASLYRTPEPAEEIESEDTFESDMKLTSQQRFAIEQYIRDTERGRDSRKAISPLSYRWPNSTVPYEISSSSEMDKGVIESALKEWESHTCLSFKPYTAELAAQLGHEGRLNFIKGRGCWSYIGFRGKQQDISIGYGCEKLGTVVHEIGHALAFFHEQSRPDRDGYIKIHSENISPGKSHNFVKYPTAYISTHDVEYDTSSLMHYGAYYFSANGRATISTLNPLEMVTIGQRERLSFSDIKLANIIYKCNERCGDSVPECKNDGYIGPNCTCVCKDNYSGDTCEVYTPSTGGCVGKLTDVKGTISSPNFPDDYDVNKLCMWLIEAPEDHTITLTFTSLKVEYHYRCRYDYVLVRTDDVYSGGKLYCGKHYPFSVTSTGNRLLIAFNSDEIITSSGFEAKWTMSKTEK